HLASVCDGGEGPLEAGRAAEYEGDLDACLRYYDLALERGLPRAERLDVLERAARAARKAGRFGEAEAYWRRLVAEPRARRLTPYVELAKLAEHQRRNPATALALTSEALSLAERGLVRPGPP